MQLINQSVPDKFKHPYNWLMADAGSYIDGKRKPCLLEVIICHLSEIKLQEQIITIKFFAQAGKIAIGQLINCGHFDLQELNCSALEFKGYGDKLSINDYHRFVTSLMIKHIGAAA